MSQVSLCPTCGSKSKIKDNNGKISYEAIQDDEAFKKISQLKKAMENLKQKLKLLKKNWKH
jgi:uncharacterized radical SAM superfamily protein